MRTTAGYFVLKGSMEIKQVNIGKVIPYARNPRDNASAVAKVAGSLKEYGWQQPIVCDSEMVIIAGHTRLLAAQSLNQKKVPVLIATDLSEAQVKAYRIADNRTGEGAEWDLDLLSLELTDLQDMDFDLELTGFDDSFIKVDEQEGLTDEDAVPEVPETPKTVLGDVWVLGNHRLMCGDSTSIDAVEKLMDGQKANLLHTDPPYGVDYEGVPNDHLKNSELERFIKEALTAAFIVLHEGSNVYVWHADISGLEFISAFRGAGFRQARPSTIQWIKDSLVLSQGDYHLQNEPCLFGWKEGKGRVRVADRKQTTLWKCDRPKESKLHPTMKPVELCERAINNSSMPNTLVLDLFGGSGSTLIASEKTSRHCRMMELDPKYCDVIINRWQDFTGKEAIHEDGRKFNEM